LYENVIYVCEFSDWNERRQLPNSNNNFFQIIDEFKNFARQWAPLIVCSDGVSACGLFVVLSYILEKYENELEIDVCNGIRIARRSGKKFVNNSKQLAFIYSFVGDYFRNIEGYDHIEE
jgi:protein tyrosine phosphatase